jgi:IS605 OrfB family transposase
MNESLTRTICIKLDVAGNEAVLAETQRRFNEAATFVAGICWQEGITNTNTAHHRVYGQTRTCFGLGAQLAICTRAKAMEAIKAVKTEDAQKLARWRSANARRRKKGRRELPPPEPGNCPAFGPRASIRYDARTYRLLSLDRVSLNTVGGRIIARLLPGRRQHGMLVDPDWHIGGAELVWRKGVYYLHVTQTKDAPKPRETSDVLGIDLGICTVAMDSQGEPFTGKEIRQKRAQYVARRAALQRVGTRSAKRRLKQMSGRERRWMSDVNHSIAKTLIQKSVASHKALALEDLTGIREGEVTVRREQRFERHTWAFYQLRQFLTYKAALVGVPVFLVDPACTSQTCSRCWYCDPANRQSQSSFRCRQCGFSCHADYNAAINIREVARQAAYGSGGTSPATSPSRLRDVGT